jgi:mRNA-degrading endonuclease RelE of RelBE toxin-antitoxin system
MNYKELPSFTKEFKQLSKKYKSLPKDLEEFKNILNTIPAGNSKHFTPITKNNLCAIIKARLFCRYLKGSSLRIIYAFHSQTNEINFIEIYFKGNKPNEDKDRIKVYLKNLPKEK